MTAVGWYDYADSEYYNVSVVSVPEDKRMRLVKELKRLSNLTSTEALALVNTVPFVVRFDSLRSFHKEVAEARAAALAKATECVVEIKVVK